MHYLLKFLELKLLNDKRRSDLWPVPGVTVQFRILSQRLLSFLFFWGYKPPDHMTLKRAHSDNTLRNTYKLYTMTCINIHHPLERTDIL